MTRFFVFFLLFFGFLDSWASCVASSTTFNFSTSGSVCEHDGGCGSVMCSWAASGRELCSSLSCETYSNSGYYYTGGRVIRVSAELGEAYDYDCLTGSGGGCAMGSFNLYGYRCNYAYRCGTQCEADSVACVYEGKIWIPGLNGQCGHCSDDDLCSDFRSECESMDGVFSGSVNNGCCIATCDQCGKLDDLVEQKRQMCCNQGLAPPDKARQCRVEARGTCGMNWSTYLSNDNEFNCQDPSLSAETSSRYASECNDKSSSSGGGSSSSGGGSSSSGGSSGSGSDECKECPYLDSILDTLSAQKAIVGNIYNCLTVPGQCGTSSKDSLSIPSWVAEKFDSTLDNQKTEIRELGKIDTSLLKLLDSVHLSLKNDTLIRQAIAGVGASIDSTIGAASDTSKKILRHIAEIMQTNELELAKHIDSIISKLPDSVLDSIVKYQKMALDDFDSAFYGSNSGFKKIDNLIDSAVKYYQEGFRHDSIYYANYGDSLGAIHGAIDGVSDKILYGLGYGDTASTTLRDDLRGYFTGVSVDTGSVGFASSWVSDGETLGDSIGRAVGWIGGLDGVNVDSVFVAGSWGESGVDSISDFLNDTLGGIVDSLHLLLQNENDSLKNSLSDSLTVWADSIVKVSPFVVFDSLIYSTIGAKIPNSDQCPEDCQSWTLTLPRFGLINYTVDFGLCLGRVPLGGLNVLGFLRLIIRLVIVWSCISIVMWTFSHRKM